MEITRPILPDFAKCQETHGWKHHITFGIADRLNEMYQTKPTPPRGILRLKAR